MVPENGHTKEKPSRAAAKRASRLAAQQLESSPARSGDESGLPSFGEPSRRKAQVKVTYFGKKTHAKRRRSLSPLTSVDSGSAVEDGQFKSPLPPFSSPPPATRSTPFKPNSSRSARITTRPGILSTRARADTAPSVTQLTRTDSLSSLSSVSDIAINTSGWGIEDHCLVFVRIDDTGAVSEAPGAMWWPAEVIELGAPMRVVLFGDYPGSSAKARAKELVVQPSPLVILPFCSGPRKLRFKVDTYTSTSRATGGPSASPRKKQRTSRADLDRRWYDARDLMLKKYQDMNDGLPLTLSLRIRGDTPEVLPLSTTPRHLVVRQPSISPSGDYSDPEDLWEPEESPYEIPGELVLAKEKRTFTQYWPAKLMSYIPPRKRGENARYKVLFYDGKVKTLADNSDMFYNEVHPKFKACLLGQDGYNYELHVGERDEDTELTNHDTMLDAELTAESLRSPSPVPQIPAPVAFASELSVEEQFRYVKPVLAGILTGHFEPAKYKHVGFMKGEKQRNAVTEAAWKRGEVTSQEKEELSRCIVRWMRRRQERQRMGLIPCDPFVTVACAPEMDGGQDKKEIHVLDDDESDYSALTELTGSYPAVDNTERAPSSEAEAPPSSFIAPDDTDEISEVGVTAGPDGDDKAPTDVDGAVLDLTRHNVLAGHVAAHAADISVVPPAAFNLDEPPPGTVPTFAHLSDLDQITYCTSVLLPEAILQILLWRNGDRQSVQLLAPAEEERLHRIAEGHANSAFWVHEILNLKHAAEGRLLPPTTTSGCVVPESAPAMGRLRTRAK
ncbi:hypothetical protein BC835DRAFT_1082750 [Cytidiella melzeri]|nr:hypothetical protein BC835DRAFT_1082750 [Cytidiella melzeri]